MFSPMFPLLFRILLENNQEAREPTPMVQHGPEHKRWLPWSTHDLPFNLMVSLELGTEQAL